MDIRVGLRTGNSDGLEPDISSLPDEGLPNLNLIETEVGGGLRSQKGWTRTRSTWTGGFPNPNLTGLESPDAEAVIL